MTSEPSNGKRRGNNAPEKKLLSIDDLKERLNLPSTQWIYERTRNGRIPGMVKLGRYCRFNPESIKTWLEELEKGDSK